MKEIDFSKIKLIVYDFDGVMTNNKVYVDQNGKEMVQVNRSDGLGVSEIKKLGIHQIIISTEKNEIVKVRANKLGLHCIHGVDDKKTALIEFCEKNKIKFDTICYVGNDINDLDAMLICGFRFCPSDAYEDIKKISTHILKTKGGNGVIREILDQIKERYEIK